jgi:predicted DNA-binding transcriptional regulator YafY
MRSELNEGGAELPLRTFHNHRQAIETLFDINIECDKRGGYLYYIENTEDMERDGLRTWLLNTFAANSLIRESRKLKHRILFEHIPSGERFLVPLIEAMKDGTRVEITYQGYRHEHSCTFEIEPCCMKVFKKRWYTVARSPNDGRIRIYGLDRIRGVRSTENKFTLPEDFDPETYFAHSFGIITGSGLKPECIEIKVWNTHNKCHYLRSLPLHASQEETEQTDTWSVFRYYLLPTYDFRQELLSHGDEIEVLSPDWFRAEMAEIVRRMNKAYKTQKK